MKNGITNQINNPHFYEDNTYDNTFTFEDLMDCALGGIGKPKMHLWLPASATQEQIDLVKKICGTT
jgi:hypothetical protein